MSELTHDLPRILAFGVLVPIVLHIFFVLPSAVIASAFILNASKTLRGLLAYWKSQLLNFLLLSICFFLLFVPGIVFVRLTDRGTFAGQLMLLGLCCMWIIVGIVVIAGLTLRHFRKSHVRPTFFIISLFPQAWLVGNCVFHYWGANSNLFQIDDEMLRHFSSSFKVMWGGTLIIALVSLTSGLPGKVIGQIRETAVALSRRRVWMKPYFWGGILGLVVLSLLIIQREKEKERIPRRSIEHVDMPMVLKLDELRSRKDIKIDRIADEWEGKLLAAISDARQSMMEHSEVWSEIERIDPFDRHARARIHIWSEQLNGEEDGHLIIQINSYFGGGNGVGGVYLYELAPDGGVDCIFSREGRYSASIQIIDHLNHKWVFTSLDDTGGRNKDNLFVTWGYLSTFNNNELVHTGKFVVQTWRGFQTPAVMETALQPFSEGFNLWIRKHDGLIGFRHAGQSGWKYWRMPLQWSERKFRFNELKKNEITDVMRRSMAVKASARNQDGVKHVFKFLHLDTLLEPNYAEIHSACLPRLMWSVSVQAEIHDVAIDSQGNVIVVGDTKSVGFKRGRQWLIEKYDASGRKLWATLENTFGEMNDEARAIALDHDGNIYVAGHEIIGGYIGGEINVIRKYGPDGKLIAKIFNKDECSMRIYDLAVTSEGHVVVVGQRDCATAFWMVRKLDLMGKVKWAMRLGGNNDSTGSRASGIAVGADGTTYVVGCKASGQSTYWRRWWTVAYDPQGHQLRANVLGDHYGRLPLGDLLINPGVDGGRITSRAESVAVGKDGLPIVVGMDYGGWLTVKYGKSGETLWSKKHFTKFRAVSSACDIAMDGNNNAVVVGYADSNVEIFDYDWVVNKYDVSGALKWSYVEKGDGALSACPSAVAYDTTGHEFVVVGFEGERRASVLRRYADCTN